MDVTAEQVGGSGSAGTIRVQLPDGSVREVARGTTPLEVATSISPRLAAAVVVARIRGRRGGGAGGGGAGGGGGGGAGG